MPAEERKSVAPFVQVVVVERGLGLTFLGRSELGDTLDFRALDVYTHHRSAASIPSQALHEGNVTNVFDLRTIALKRLDLLSKRMRNIDPKLNLGYRVPDFIAEHGRWTPRHTGRFLIP